MTAAAPVLAPPPERHRVLSAVQVRCLVLALALAAIAAAGWLLPRPGAASLDVTAFWPAEDGAFAVAGWTVSPPTRESAWGVDHLTRSYERDGLRATLIVSSSPAAKRIYGGAPVLAFMGSGYAAEPAPAGLLRPVPRRGGAVLRGSSGRYLLLYTYGERRGLLGNGPSSWGPALLDAVRGQPNAYYLLRLLVPLDEPRDPAARAAEELAGTLFPRIAVWYAH